MGRCSLLIALACAAGSACSHRRRDTGRDTPYHLLDLCRPSDGRRARRDWRRRGAQLQRRLPPCVYDERPRLPVGLAVGAADQGPRACHSARGLTGRERDLRFRGPGTEGSNPAPSRGEMVRGRRRRRWHHRRWQKTDGVPRMPPLNDLSRSLVALDQDSTIIAVVELSQSSWLVAGVLPGIERQPQKKLEPSAERLLGLLHRWRDEAVRAGKKITRISLL